MAANASLGSVAKNWNPPLRVVCHDDWGDGNFGSEAERNGEGAGGDVLIATLSFAFGNQYPNDSSL